MALAIVKLMMMTMAMSPLMMRSVFSLECPVSCRCSVVAGRNLTICQDSGLTLMPKPVDTNTNFLDLSANKLDHLENNTFMRMSLLSLEIIDLKKCNLRNISKFAFAELKWLKELDLSDNAITTIDPLLFTDNKMLELVNMSGNPIVSLHSFQFSAMPRLKILDLRNCQLNAIEREALSSLTSLETLNFQNNRLTTLPRNIFMWMSSLKSVILDENPWRCNCDLQLLTVGLRMRGLYKNWSCIDEYEGMAVLWHNMNNISAECVPQFGSYIKEVIVSAPPNSKSNLVFSVMNVNRRVLRHLPESKGVSWLWVGISTLVASSCLLFIVRIIMKRKRRGRRKNYDYEDEEVGLEGLRCDIYRDYDEEKPSTSYNNESFSLLDDLSSDDMSISMDL